MLISGANVCRERKPPSRELPQREILGEPRGHLRCFFDDGKCTSSIPVMYPAGEVTRGYLSCRVVNGTRKKEGCGGAQGEGKRTRLRACT